VPENIAAFIIEEVTEFAPDWPDIFPHGFVIARQSATPIEAQGDAPRPTHDEIGWTMKIGVRHETPRLALVADLIARNPVTFAGVTVMMPFELRDEPEAFTVDFVNQLLTRYGEWASSIMYDHAAFAMRSMLAGNGLPALVPVDTPDVRLEFASVVETESTPT
jgi:hypothetical protein